jgi:hypothetical protein
MPPVQLPWTRPLSDPAHPVVRATFQLLGGELEDFAERHSLLVERFPRGFSMWSFLFHHPKGGAASLQFNIALQPGTAELTGSLLPHWWLDLEPGNRRLVAEFQSIPLPSLAPADVRATLEQALDRVIGTDESALTREMWIRRSYQMPDLPWPTGLTGSQGSPGR